MKFLPLLALLLGGLIFSAGTIDLNNLYNYENQPIPAYITKDNTPLDNPITNEGATLGRVLFYDPSLSADFSVSCASCHLQEFAFGDTAMQSVGMNGLSGRHSMRLVNARFGDDSDFFWDRRALSLEDQSTQPIQDHIEMGFSGTLGDPDLDSLIRRMRTIDYYTSLFEFAFGDDSITEDRMQLALAQFVSSIQSFDAKYDVGRALVSSDAMPFPNYTPAENAGKQLFLDPIVFDPLANRIGGGIGCAPCHRPPEFDIDPGTENNAITVSFTIGMDFSNTRSPSLRDMVDAAGVAHGGFMHDGGATTGNTLNGVLDHYNQIPGLLPAMDPRLRVAGNPQNLMLTPLERMQVIAFLRTLTGNNVYTDPKWSDPFVGGSLDLIALQCGSPEPLVSENVTATGVELSWQKVADAQGYRISGTNLTTGQSKQRYIYNPNDTTLVFSGVLSPATTYVWTVEAGCSTTDISPITAPDTFTTLAPRAAAMEVESTVYPNPASDFVYISNLPVEAIIALEVFDASGRLVRQSLENSAAAGELVLAIQDLAPGSYTISLKANGWEVASQLLVQ